MSDKKKIKDEFPPKEIIVKRSQVKRTNVKRLYRKPMYIKSDLKSVEVTDGESIESKVERIIHNQEPITDGSPEIFTPLKDGVIPELNIRTDRFEVAADAMDYVTRSLEAKREDKAKLGATDKEAKAISGETDKDVAKGKSTQGTTESDKSTKSD